MKVYDQLGDALAGEFLHGGLDIVLELVKVVGGESADVDLETAIRRGNRVLAIVLLTAPVLPSGRIYDLIGPALPATGGIVGVCSRGRPMAEAVVRSWVISAMGCNFVLFDSGTRLFKGSVSLLTPLVEFLTAQLASQLRNLNQSTNTQGRRTTPTKWPYP